MLRRPMACHRFLAALALAAAFVAAGCSHDSEDRPTAGQARPRLPAQRGARRHLPGAGARLRRPRASPSASRRRVLERQRQAAAGRPCPVRDPRHPRSRPGAREGARHRRGHGARAAPAGRRHRPAADHAAARAQGKRAGVTGLPSDDAVLDSIVRGDGGDPAKVRKVSIGFQAVTALLARRVDSATAFWNAEGVALGPSPGHAPVQGRRLRRPGLPRARAVCEPSDAARQSHAGRATVRALRRGYEETVNDPESAVEALVERAGVQRAATRRELDAVSPTSPRAPRATAPSIPPP